MAGEIIGVPASIQGNQMASSVRGKEIAEKAQRQLKTDAPNDACALGDLFRDGRRLPGLGAG